MKRESKVYELRKAFNNFQMRGNMETVRNEETADDSTTVVDPNAGTAGSEAESVHVALETPAKTATKKTAKKKTAAKKAASTEEKPKKKAGATKADKARKIIAEGMAATPVWARKKFMTKLQAIPLSPPAASTYLYKYGYVSQKVAEEATDE